MCQIVSIEILADGRARVAPDQCDDQQPQCRRHSAPYVAALAGCVESDVDALGGRSHVVTIKTELTDLAAIKTACTRMGWQFKANQRTYRWYGHLVGDYHGADNAAANGIKAEDLGKCDHAISVPGANYEIGLVVRGKKIIPVWDFWGPGGLSKVRSENGMAGFVAAYAIEKCKAEARRMGKAITENKLPNGSVQLVIQT